MLLIIFLTKYTPSSTVCHADTVQLKPTFGTGQQPGYHNGTAPDSVLCHLPRRDYRGRGQQHSRFCCLLWSTNPKMQRRHKSSAGWHPPVCPSRPRPLGCVPRVGAFAQRWPRRLLPDGTKPPCSSTRWCDVLTVGAVGGRGHSHLMSPGHLCSPPSPDSPPTARLGIHAEIRIAQCSSPCLQPAQIQVPFADAMDIFQHLIKRSPRGYSGQSCRIKLWMSHS